VKRHPIDLLLAFLVLTVLTACNLPSAPAGIPSATSPRSTAPALLPTTAVPTPTPERTSPTPRPPTLTPRPPSRMPGPLIPTPIDLSTFPSVSWMGRNSLTQGWVYTGAQILWTDDAGASWSDITPAGLSNCPEPDICSISSPPVFLDPSQVRISVIRGQELVPPTTLSFMYTENGGRTWRLQQIADFAYSLLCPGPPCITGADMEFPDPQNGWLAAHAPLGMSSDIAYLYRTRDGGQTWTLLPIPITGRITFIDASTGWAVGGKTRWTSDQLLETQDGGNSWQPIRLDFPVSYDETGYYLQEPVFLSHQAGVLPVRFYRDEDIHQLMGFYTTQNGGGTWSLSTTLQERDLRSFGRGGPIPWSAIDESTWFVAVSDAKQYLTRDRGQTWQAIAASGLSGAKLLEVQFVTETEGWGLGQICDRDTGCSQPMFATHDGGRTWIPIAPAP